MNRDEAISTLKAVVSTDKRHQDYKRVCDLADKYKKLITGEEIGTLLRRFVMRESEEMFRQREEITQTITPTIAERIQSPYYKTARVKPVVDTIDWEGDGDTSERVNKLNAVLEKYNGEISLNDYMETMFIDASFVDPNSWWLTLFYDFDHQKETPVPYPVMVSCEQAIDFEYRQNLLEYLVVQSCIKYKTQNGDQDGHRYQIYVANDVVQFTQVDSQSFANVRVGETAIGPEGQMYFRAKETMVFLIEFFEPKSGIVPARRIGYKLDKYTSGRTYVNPFHAAMPYFMKSLKIVSEFDFTMLLHAFPQKFIYSPRCKGKPEKPCTDGRDPVGAICEVCKGTGKVAHTSGQDVIELTLPNINNSDKMFDLEKLVHYSRFPIEVSEFQNKVVNEIGEKAMHAVFNSDLYSKNEVEQTAYGKNIELQSVYDTLYPFMKNYGAAKKYTIIVTANYVSLGAGLIVNIQYPKDMKFKTEAEILNELQTATTSNAPTYIREDISNDLAQVRYIDRPLDMQRLKTKQMFDPFRGKTETQVMWILQNNKCTKRDATLWTEFANIFTELENEGLEANPPYWFYDLIPKKQRALLEKKIDEYIKKIESDFPPVEAVEFSTEMGGQGADGVSPVPESDVQAEAQAKLKGTVGGVDGILSIQQSVASGTTDYDSAIATLIEIYGFPDKTARKILGKPKPKATPAPAPAPPIVEA